MHRASILMATERALTEAECADFLRLVLQSNPRLRGAKVADLLDMAEDADAYLVWTDPAAERYGAEMIGFALVRLTTAQAQSERRAIAQAVVRYAWIVTAVLAQGVPSDAEALYLTGRIIDQLNQEAPP